MMTEMESLAFDDLMCEWASMLEQKGARHLLNEFRERYPHHYKEMEARFLPAPQIAALFQPKNAV